MITSQNQHHDEDEEDLDMLRKIAMESLKKGRESEYPNSQEDNQSGQQFPMMYPEQSNEFHNSSFAPVIRHQRMPRMPNYMRPRFMNNLPVRHPVRPFIAQQRMPPAPFPVHQPMPAIHDYPPVPHVNPQFLAQQPQPSQIFQPIAEFPQADYVPTPTIRLSPRSAEFIAANEQAIMKASSKRYSRSPPSRRRSRSPTRRRSRSKSPFKRRSPLEGTRKRYRSKSPDNRVYKARNNSPKTEKRSKSPRNRSQSPRNARFSRLRGGRYNNNGNGRHNRKRSESDKEDEKRSHSKSKEEAVLETTTNTKVDDKSSEKEKEKEKTPSPVPEEKSTTPPIVEKKEKTAEEIEDELLASTDDDDDGLDINMDEKELDFLEDDSESENEGRFKSKPSSNVKPSMPSKPSYSSKSYDKGKSSYSSSRHDYRRDDKYSSKRKKLPDPEPRKKSPVERKSIVLNKDKDDSKQMFKSTFKSVDSSDKKTESSKKSESRVTLVRSFVGKSDSSGEYESSNSPSLDVQRKNSSDKKSSTSSVKSVITVNEESSKAGGKKKILERLGEYIGTKGKIDGNRCRATKQV